jgi:hypothetical protein
MAAGYPLSRQAAQPERTPRPPHPSNTRHHHPPHGLQPQPQAAATFSPASAPDLIRELLPGTAAAANALGLDPGAPGNQLYRYCFSSRRLRLRSLAAMSS